MGCIIFVWNGCINRQATNIRKNINTYKEHLHQQLAEMFFAFLVSLIGMAGLK